MTRVSVIIPTYNRKETIAAAIRSVLAQTSPVLEILVVDDGSTDDTQDFLREAFGESRVKCIRQENSGAGAARNLGISLAEGDWVAFLDSDDVWRPRKVEHFLEALRENPGACFYYTAVSRSGDAPESLDGDEDFVRERCDNLFLLSHFVISTSTVVVKRDFVRNNKILFGTLRSCEDYEFFWKIVVADGYVVYNKWIDTIVNFSKNSLMSTQNVVDTFYDNFNSVDNVIFWSLSQNIHDKYAIHLDYLKYREFKYFISALIIFNKYFKMIMILCKHCRIDNFSKVLRALCGAFIIAMSTEKRNWIKRYSIPKGT